MTRPAFVITVARSSLALSEARRGEAIALTVMGDRSPRSSGWRAVDLVRSPSHIATPSARAIAASRGGVLDTSAVIALGDLLEEGGLPDEPVITTVTLSRTR